MYLIETENLFSPFKFKFEFTLFDSIIIFETKYYNCFINIFKNVASSSQVTKRKTPYKLTGSR